MPLLFKPVDLSCTFQAALTLACRHDSSVHNGIEEQLKTDPEKHFAYLRQRQAYKSECACFVLENDEFVGMSEFGPQRTEPEIGYINFLYVAPHCRQRGIGGKILAHDESLLKSWGFKKARLRSVISNDGNVSFYRKHGWTNTGPCTEKTYCYLWEKNL